jgi:hypothetical protein
MAEKMPIRIREVAKVPGDVDYYVKSEPVPPGEIWCLQGIAYENETGARGTFRRYIEGHGYNHYVAEHTSPGAGELVFTNQIIYLIPGERLVISQESCKTNDILALYAHGYKVHSKFIPGGDET